LFFIVKRLVAYGLSPCAKSVLEGKIKDAKRRGTQEKITSSIVIGTPLIGRNNCLVLSQMILANPLYVINASGISYSFFKTIKYIEQQGSVSIGINSLLILS